MDNEEHKDKTDDSPGGPQPPVPETKPEENNKPCCKNPATSIHDKPTKPLWRTPPFWQAFFSGCLVVNAGITIFFLSGQLKNSTAAIDISRQSLVSVQRAFVIPPGGFSNTFDEQSGFRIATAQLENTGSTRTNGARFFITSELHEGGTPAFKFDGMSYPLTVEPKQKFDAVVNIEPTSWTGVDKNGRHLFIWGWIVYRDVFDGTAPHLTEFCFEVTSVLGEPASNYRGFYARYENCAKRQHTCADEQCPPEEIVSARRLMR